MAAKSWTAEHDDQAILLHVANKDLHAGDFDLIQLLTQPRADVARNPPRTTVRNVSGRVDRTKIPADGDIIRAKFEVNSQRLQDTATDVVLQRVIAKQAQMPRSASGRNSRQHRNAEAQ